MNRTLETVVRTGVIGLAAGAALALTPPTSAQPAPQPASNNLTPADNRDLISFKYGGGSIQDYVRAVQAASSTNINVIIADEVASLAVPPVDLKTITVPMAMQLLRKIVTQNNAQVIVETEGDPFGRGAFIYTIRGFPPNQTPFAATQAQPRETELQIYSVRDLLDPPAEPGVQPRSVPVETLLAAIDSAMTMLPENAERPQVKFHQDAGVLIVRADRSQQKTIASLLQTMRGDMRDRITFASLAVRQARERERALAAGKRSMERAMSEVEVAKEEYVVAKERLSRVGKLFEAGQISADEADEAKLVVQRRSAAFELAQAKLREHEAMIAEQQALIAEEAGENTRAMLYDVADLKAMMPEVLSACRATAGSGATITLAGESADAVIIRASPDRQAAVATVLTAIRRIKTNNTEAPEVAGKPVEEPQERK